jgi:hypothetical protein
MISKEVKMAKRPSNTSSGVKKTKAKKPPTKKSKKAAKKAVKKSGKKAVKKKKVVAQSPSTQSPTTAPSGTMVPTSFEIDGAGSEDEILRGAFEKIIARGNQHNKSPVCYSQLSDGMWEVCLLQTDGSYGQCERYYGPVHTPICGG